MVWGEPAKNFAQIVGKGDLVSVQGRLEYSTREIDGQRVKEAEIRVTAWTQHTPKRDGDQPAADPDGDGFQDDEAQHEGDAGGTDLTGELAGDGNPLPADDAPLAENPPADEEPATAADPTSTTKRGRRK